MTEERISPNFMIMPPEIKLGILDQPFTPWKIIFHIEMKPTIHDKVALEPWWILNRRWKKEHITYKFCCSSDNGQNIAAQSLMGMSMNFARMTRVRKPCYLQISDGQRIYFHPERDTIRLDLLSLFNLSMLARATINHSKLSLTGFDQIRRLSMLLKNTLYFRVLNLSLAFIYHLCSRWPNGFTGSRYETTVYTSYMGSRRGDSPASERGGSKWIQTLIKEAKVDTVREGEDVRLCTGYFFV